MVGIITSEDMLKVLRQLLKGGKRDFLQSPAVYSGGERSSAGNPERGAIACLKVDQSMMGEPVQGGEVRGAGKLPGEVCPEMLPAHLKASRPEAGKIDIAGGSKRGIVFVGV